jgi:hypothetical protein
VPDLTPKNLEYKIRTQWPKIVLYEQLELNFKIQSKTRPASAPEQSMGQYVPNGALTLSFKKIEQAYINR